MHLQLQILIFLFCGVLLTPFTLADEACTQSGPCSCDNSKGTIDLNPLANTDGTAKYQDLGDGTGQWYYSYNPCKEFSEGAGVGDCTNVAVCQTDKAASFFNLGTQDSAKFGLDPTTQVLQLQYSATTETTRDTYVNLKCDPKTDSVFEVNGETPPGSAQYYFTLTSKYCCPSTNPGPGPNASLQISVGSIFVIVFFAIVFVYIIAGFAFQVFIRKASGREMVPNYGLWSIIPGLIKDGVLFTFTCGRYSGYGQV